MRILVLGAGRMGSWFAGMLSKTHKVVVYDRDPAKTVEIKGVEAIKEMEDIRSFKPGLMINAVSLKNVVSAFTELTPYLNNSCIISDIASIKGELKEYYDGCGFRYVSFHPMFGPTFANLGALKDESVIFIKGSCKEGVDFFKDFFRPFGLKTLEYSFYEHDRMMAYSLTLPFICSMAFAASLDKAAVPGTTFARHLRIAEGLLSEDDQLLGEVLFNPHSLPEIDVITAKLEYLKHIIREKDHEELGHFLKRLRENMG